jgi:adenine C2-methylase RlmN of 23S rRNA A2503 and tRNA A37
MVDAVSALTYEVVRLYSIEETLSMEGDRIRRENKRLRLIESEAKKLRHEKKVLKQVEARYVLLVDILESTKRGREIHKQLTNRRHLFKEIPNEETVPF